MKSIEHEMYLQNAHESTLSAFSEKRSYINNFENTP